MSYEALQAIVGTALTDKQFLQDLLDGKRRQVLSRFELTPEEHQLLLGLRVSTLEELAAALDEWLESRRQDSYLCRTPVVPYPVLETLLVR